MENGGPVIKGFILSISESVSRFWHRAGQLESLSHVVIELRKCNLVKQIDTVIELRKCKSNLSIVDTKNRTERLKEDFRFCYCCSIMILLIIIIKEVHSFLSIYEGILDFIDFIFLI